MANDRDLLLDTHAVLWWAFDLKSLSAKALDAIRKADVVRCSSISLIEISLKQKKESIIPIPFSDLQSFIRERGNILIEPFPVEAANVFHELPPIHKDPFDRMLIAHAIAMGLTLVSRDPEIHQYPVPFLW